MNLTWQLTLIIVAGFAFLAFIIWLEYKKKDKKQKPFTNPLMVAVVAGTFISLTIFILEAIDLLPPGWSKEHPWIFLLIFIAVFFASATYLRWLKPKNIDELKSIVEKRLWLDGNAKIYNDKGSRDPWMAYEVQETKDESLLFNKVINFLVLAKSNKVQPYFLTIDLIDGKPLAWRPNPPKDLIEKKFSKEITANLDLNKIVAEQAFVESHVDNENNGGQAQPEQ